MNFTLTNYNLADLNSKSKLIQHLNTMLNKAYFKVGEDEFVFMLRGQNGAFKLTLPISCSAKPSYFSIDFNKWNIALQKFTLEDQINFSLTKNFLTVSTSGSNTINLGVNTYDETSSEAAIIDSFIDTKKADITSINKRLTLTTSLVGNLQLADSLFVAQAKVNAVGISPKNIMYSDRAVVLKIAHNEIINEDLFKGLPADEEYIYLHTYVLKLFAQLSKSGREVYFSDDYSTIYWEDDNSKLIFVSEEREVALPTEEQFESIQPEDKTGTFTVSLKTLREGLDFFIGFYEGSVWKPITFESSANKEVILHYKHPTTEISKTLDNCMSPVDGKFIIDSENLTKVVTKLENIYTEETPMSIVFDEDAPGIYCNVEGSYEFILSKLDDEE